ncbi:MAG: hypothetical protein ACREM1_16710, partial [Longimicrobiales bacterium]
STPEYVTVYANSTTKQMVERSGHDLPGPLPLPREWLPAAAPPEDASEWEAGARRILAAAEPSLWRLSERRPAVDATWSMQMGSWWKPAAVMAAAAGAAVAVLVLIDPFGSALAADRGSVSLSVVAAEGDPVALWEALGIEADPVLARIAIQEPVKGGSR